MHSVIIILQLVSFLAAKPVQLIFHCLFSLSLEGDPNNYLTYFKRGTVYLALGKAKNALSDFDRVIELKPDFTAARLSRGTINLKQADYDLAQLDFYNVVSIILLQSFKLFLITTFINHTMCSNFEISFTLL